jgi:hypothetical protein
MFVLVRMNVLMSMAVHMRMLVAVSHAVAVSVLMCMGVCVFVLMAVLVFAIHAITSRTNAIAIRELPRLEASASKSTGPSGVPGKGPRSATGKNYTLSAKIKISVAYMP